MDAKIKEICKDQLESLVKALSSTSDKEADWLMLETAASMISLVNKSISVEDMTKGELEEFIKVYEIIYYALDSFMEEAARTVSLNEEQIRLMNAKNLYKEKTQERDELKQERDKKNDEIAVKEAEIKALLGTKGTLFEKFEELSRRHDYLLDLSTKFDPQKLDELSSEIDHLKEVTDALKERETTINETLGEWLADLSKTLKVIGENTSVCSEEAEKAKNDAEEFRTAIDVFVKTSNSYKSWFNVVKTPWKQFEEMAGTAEYKKLRGVTDEATLKEKNEIFRRVEKDLERLETLISACEKASQSDYDEVQKVLGK